MRKRKIILSAVLIFVVFLLLPLIFNKKGYQHFEAPSLSDIDYSEVFFTNEGDDLKLAGMLMVPEGEGPFPTAVIIQGSGPSFRDNGWYLSVVKHLQDNGIAVIIPDKRGCEKSEGEWIGASFNELATDAISAIEYIKTQDRFEHAHIGLVGMSQGGWIAPVAATKSKDVSFIASLSGATVSTDEQLLHEEVYNISEYTYPFIAKMIAPTTTNRIKKMPHFSAFAGFDPIPYLKKVDVPVLFAFGEGDKNVPVTASIERLEKNGLNDFEVITYPKGGHAIMDVKSNTVSKRCLNDLATFINGLVF
ncbi:alpha/beta hydrolase family protein [Ulvibacterium marinum]|uniref:Alpha/beta fold hydrolase n=1 Tax=Ulvibacterium marinum TaxID=2419782 RepID=A0A3B0C9K3_9FLAO|nr:alpha/beta fold hydrolase [Ulvibacterium marinum]RKN81194.1 alpha/beta fold hydrolase [Ulvibacterium marinum]